jgi:hypothetical protein
LRFTLLSEHIQAFFREWHAIDHSVASNIFMRYYDYDFMAKLHVGMTAEIPDDEFESQFIANIRFIEQLAGQLVSTVIESYADDLADEAIRSQVERWQADTFLGELIALYREEEEKSPMNSGWITLGHRSREKKRVTR